MGEFQVFSHFFDRKEAIMKQYKCGYGHCAHKDGKVDHGEAVKIGNRYWHKDCYEISELIKEIEQDYIDNVSSTVVVSYLRKVINDIVFGKKLENKGVDKPKSNLEAARYLSFCLKYSIEHNLKLSHVPGLYYIIDNSKIRKAWDKECELKVQKEMKEDMMEEKTEASVPVSTVPTTKKPFSSGSTGFGSILGGNN